MGRRLLRFRRRTRRIAVVSGLSLTVVISTALLLAASLAQTAPSWWRRYTLDDDLRAHATSVENAAVSQLTKTRPADPAWAESPGGEPWRSERWSIALREEDANAWLTGRLANWIAGDDAFDIWPEGLDQPQVHFERGAMRLGAQLRFEKGRRVLSAAIRPEFRENGSLWLRTDWVHIGRLPLPAGPMLARADDAIRDELPDEIGESFSAGTEAAGFFDILRGNAPLSTDPTIRLDDGRSIRLLDLRLKEGRIEIDCQTVARRTAARE
jgi:hypothetical protein